MLVYQLNILNELDLVQELQQIHCDPYGIKIMREKRSLLTLKITDLAGHIGLIIKETALSCGAEFALPKEIIQRPDKVCSGILLINKHQLNQLIQKIVRQSFRQIKELIPELKKFLKEEKYRAPIIMGILNVTPDSFSDGGKFFTLTAALAQAKQMIKAGAKIIDIGGESTRPGAGEISSAQEIKRTIPVIKALRKINKKILISIDTTKSQVAKAAVKAGANIINDISGLRRDEKIATVAAKHKTKLILMHRLAPSKTMQKNPVYKDILREILLSLQKSIKLAISRGVKKENIIIDPGIGFGKTLEHNLYLIKNLCAFKALGCPVMVGTSRKSVIGGILKNIAEKRVAGTIATNLFAQLNKVDYIRVHDVQENSDAVKMFNALLCQ